jgi:hypothetical protein
VSTTHTARSSPTTDTAYAAYAAAALFALHLATYFAPALRDATLATAAPIAVALGVLAIAQHLVVFPVVAVLPAPRWARVAAYVWLIFDLGSDLLQLGGMSKSVYLVIRLAVNVLVALWIASASLRASGATQGIGLFVALDTVAYACVGLFVSWGFVVTLPTLILLPVWFALVGRSLAGTTSRLGAARPTATIPAS